MEEMSNDIVRFMDKNKITLATIGGHGFGAKVAAATAINHMDRFTGVLQYEGGPLDHRYYEAYYELKDYVNFAKTLKLENLDYSGAVQALNKGIACRKWAKIFAQNLDSESAALSWKVNLDALH